MEYPEYKIEKVANLVPYARNSRTHSAEQVAQIAASIREFGFTNPVLIDEQGGIIAGHGRLLAAQKLGFDEVPAITLQGLSDAQKKAYVIADNKLALNAGWNDEMLRVEFQELEEIGFDLELTGFTLDEIEEILFDDDCEIEMPELNTGDKEPYQQKTFTLHDEQVAIVDEAVMLARTNPLSDTGINENGNGNALSLICQQWLEAINGKR